MWEKKSVVSDCGFCVCLCITISEMSSGRRGAERKEGVCFYLFHFIYLFTDKEERWLCCGSAWLEYNTKGRKRKKEKWMWPETSYKQEEQSVAQQQQGRDQTLMGRGGGVLQACLNTTHLPLSETEHSFLFLFPRLFYACQAHSPSCPASQQIGTYKHPFRHLPGNYTSKASKRPAGNKGFYYKYTQRKDWHRLKNKKKKRNWFL